MTRVGWLAVGEHEVPADDAWLSERERAWLDRMRFPKRRLEYRVARWGAKQAIRATLEPPQSGGLVEIGYLPEGAPAGYVDGAPLESRISMTDRAGWAVCAVAPPGIEVGIDLELVEPRSAAFVADYFTEAERDASLRPDGVDPVRSNLIWSAKEAALKVLRTGLRRDTRTVEITGDDVRSDGWVPFVASVDGGARVFPGWWRRYGEFLLTVAADGSTAAPELLRPDKSLAGATPIHSWLPESSG